jgi:hypothetical protein
MKHKQLCDKKMSFEECELTILRHSVDKITKQTGYQLVMQPEIKKIIDILETFLKKTKTICYGGTAINNILPLEDQFYDKKVEIPDYDFFSAEPVSDAIKLADIYHKAGFNDVEAKAGVHHGTYKVYVNFIPIADITFLHPELFKNLYKESIRVNGIMYAAPNYLRMAMYLELSRPKGDVSRWEKVLKRISLLNKHYPLKGIDCIIEDIQRPFSVTESKRTNPKQIFNTIRDSFIDQGCVFFGAFANASYMNYNRKSIVDNVPDFDVLSEDPETSAIIVKERLNDLGIKRVNVKKYDAIGEVIPEHFTVSIHKDVVAFIYKTIACHSYNTKRTGSKTMRIATIDTMLSFYLAFLYADSPVYDVNRILCMSENLFRIQQKNRLKQSGILKRFTTLCYGNQETMESIRAEKSEMFKKLKLERNSPTYNEWFLRYIPSEITNTDKKRVQKSVTRRKPKKKTKGTRRNKKTKSSTSLFGLLKK